jgi:hypothetical protein
MGSILPDWADSFSLWLIQARVLDLSMRENEQEPQQLRAFGAPLTGRELEGSGYFLQLWQRGLLLMTPLVVTHSVQRCFRQELHNRVCS